MTEAKFDLLWYLQNGAHLLAGRCLVAATVHWTSRWLDGTRHRIGFGWCFYVFLFQSPFPVKLSLFVAEVFRNRWMQSGISGGFAKKHRTTVFKPFKIQELMIDAVLQPGVVGRKSLGNNLWCKHPWEAIWTILDIHKTHKHHLRSYLDV